MYFDHPSGNHFHWLGDGLLHLFSGLVDAGLIDPETNRITEVRAAVKLSIAFNCIFFQEKEESPTILFPIYTMSRPALMELEGMPIAAAFTLEQVFTLFILNPARHYGNVPPNNGFKEFIRLLLSRCPVKRACRVEYLNDLSPFSCIQFSRLHYVSEAVGLDHRNSLDIAPHLNPAYTPERWNALDKKNLTRVRMRPRALLRLQRRLSRSEHWNCELV